MKKNKFLKLASGLLVLCLLTTCIISTTFAKYTTSGNAADTARVAKWGVTVAVQSEDAFGNKYDDAFNASGTKVISVDGKDVVAPGTNGTLASFSVKGTPEVAVKLDFVVTTTAGDANATDIYLLAGTYDNATKEKETENYILAADYHPIKFTIKKGDTVVSGYDGVTLAEVEEYIEGLSQASIQANTPLDATYVITWAWAYEDQDDVADTILGNMAAGIETTKGSLNIDFKLTITATQID